MINYCGPSDSRYSSKRIRIITLPGDKFEGQLPKEDIMALAELRHYIDACIKCHGKDVVIPPDEDDEEEYEVDGDLSEYPKATDPYIDEELKDKSR